MEEKVVKGKFIWRKGQDRERVVASIKKKIESNYFFSKDVLMELTDRLGPNFSSLG